MTNPERYLINDILAGDDDTALLTHIASRIIAGAVFVYPTDTIYGIGGRYDSKAVFDTIIAAKGRSSGHPMLLIAGSLDCFECLQLTLPPAAEKCAEAFWPGLLTMVLPSGNNPEGIGIRLSDHPLIAALSSQCKVPLYSTSANRSGVPYVPDPDCIYSEIGSHVDFMIDAGLLPPSEPSTVIRIGEDSTVTVLREGCISSEQIAAVVK